MEEKNKKKSDLGDLIGQIAVNRIKSEIPGIESANQTIDDLKTEIKEIKDNVEKERFSAILIIGIFASVITFLSVQVQILTNVSDIYQIGFLSFLTLTGLFLFLFFIFALVYFPKNNFFWIIMGAIFCLLFFSTIIFGFLSSSYLFDKNLEKDILKPGLLLESVE